MSVSLLFCVVVVVVVVVVVIVVVFAFDAYFNCCITLNPIRG